MKEKYLHIIYLIKDLYLGYIKTSSNSVKNTNKDFPGGAVVRNPPAKAGDTGSSPGLGGSHMPRSN